MKKQKALSKKEIVFWIQYEIKDAIKSARRCHRQYLASIRDRDFFGLEYFYEGREQSLQLARRIKDLMLPLEEKLPIYRGGLHESRQRRWEREEAAECEQPTT